MKNIQKIKTPLKKLSRGESGQTMILAVIAMIILTLAILFLFDLQSIIRGKIKAQSAVDAAALAAGNWQCRSLNMIGEINLIKACTVLVYDFAGTDTPEAIIEANDMLSQMQSRISFVGPLIGFGAAQQAAKNNGMTPLDHYDSVVEQHLENLRSNFIYGEQVGIPQDIQGYAWRDPYRNMIQEVLDGGIAAAPDVAFADLPFVIPPWLLDLRLYDAIEAQYWCTLRFLLRDDSTFEGSWWQIEYAFNTFVEESEYMPLRIAFARDMSVYDTGEAHIGTLATRRGLRITDRFNPDQAEDTDELNTPLPYITWCIYDSTWAPSSAGYNGPDTAFWNSNTYLRSDLRQEYVYGGPAARLTCQVNPPTVSGHYETASSLKSDKLIEETGVAPNAQVYSSATAKPLGKLEGDLPPYQAGLVLPVFNKTRLIPVAMQNYNPTLYDPFNEQQYLLLQFLMWLRNVNDIDNPSSPPPAGTNRFLSCLQKLNDPTWRHQGYNPNYTYTPPGATADYNPASDTGAGWLQAGYEYLVNEDGDILDIVRTNEDTCNYWPSGGTGNRDGPSVIH